MKNLSKVLIGILVVIIIIAIPVVSGYNNLVALEQKVDTAQSNIDTQLQRRSDLIPNLVSTVKGYANLESEIYTNIADARSKLAGASTIQEEAAADHELTSALSRLLVVVENYPDLKSSNVEAVCCYIRVSGRVKKSIITLHQKTGKVTMSTAI